MPSCGTTSSTCILLQDFLLLYPPVVMSHIPKSIYGTVSSTSSCRQSPPLFSSRTCAAFSSSYSLLCFAAGLSPFLISSYGTVFSFYILFYPSVGPYFSLMASCRTVSSSYILLQDHLLFLYPPARLSPSLVSSCGTPQPIFLCFLLYPPVVLSPAPISTCGLSSPPLICFCRTASYTLLWDSPFSYILLQNSLLLLYYPAGLCPRLDPALVTQILSTFHVWNG